jgi:hypothetical protein
MQREYVALFRAVCTSRRMAELRNHDSRLFYVLLLTQCDSWGRVTADSRQLHVLVWAMFGASLADTETALDDLGRVGLIDVHELGRDLWIQIPDWEEKAGTVGRVDRRGTSKFPGPSPDSLRTHSGLTPRTIEVIPDQVRSEERRGEEKREEKKAPSGAPADKPPSISKPRKEPTGEHAEFIAWWCAAYELATGASYGFQGGKDAKHVQRILARPGGSQEARRRASIMLTCAPEWMAKGGIDLGTLDAQWNKLASAGNVQVATGSKQAVLSRQEPEMPLLDLYPAPKAKELKP